MKKINCLLLITLFIMLFSITTVFADVQYTDNLVPTMTSNTSPSGIVSSSEYYSTLTDWRAFDKNTTYTLHAWATTKTYGWLAYEFSSPQIITKYTITTANNTGAASSFAPKNWTFEGWDGTQWITLDTRSNITGWTALVKNEFYFENTVAYNKYRINISANGGSSSNTVNLIITELEMMGPSLPIPTTPTLTATAGIEKVDLSWDAVANATGYNVKRATVAGGPYTTIATNINTTTYPDTTATSGTTYFYTVTAVNAQGESSNSNEVAVSPIANSESVSVESTADTVNIGATFTTDIILHGGTNICAEDFKVTYNTELFEYVGYEAVPGLTVYKEIADSTTGTVRMIVASLGKDNAINGDKTLVKLKFKAKKAGKDKIDVVRCRIADNGTFEKDLLETNCGEKEITVKPNSDVNRTGEFTLLDLAIDAWYYGMPAAETDTTKYDADVVLNGTIDNSDLTAIVAEILNNTNYQPNN